VPARPVEQRPQLVLGRFQRFALSRRQVAAGAVDVERQHRHRRAVRIGLASMAVFGRTLERACDRHGIVQFEHTRAQVERIAGFGHML
jgi:hypothetical protein